MNNKLPTGFFGRAAIVLCFFVCYVHTIAQVPQPLRLFLQKPALQGASVSFMVKEVGSGDVLYCYDTEREMTPASVMKTVTTATALELLGEDFCFETSILYDGEIREGILNGNLYIYGSGDPTLNSSELETVKDSILVLWTLAIQEAGIQRIAGRVIADESIFDTEGVSMKWMREDLGSGYGQGSYGLNFFDNQYTLYLRTGASGTQPVLLGTEPAMPNLTFYNYLKISPIPSDSTYIVGSPFSNERYLYGVMRTNQNRASMRGDIPDPALSLAKYFSDYLINNGIGVDIAPSCHRILTQLGEWKNTSRHKLLTTYSPPLKEIVRITNFVSHNMYADALLKTLGLQFQSNHPEVASSFEKGSIIIKDYWKKKGLNTTSLRIFDGSGLAITNKVTVEFLCDMYIYMATQSNMSGCFIGSLPQPGLDGTVRNFLRGSSLQGKTRLKSGSMSWVQCFGGYITKDGKQYAVALLINNFSGRSNLLRGNIEALLLSLF
ncbi:MAG: D-alanyl-D-alanine carboxypeptidase/D-alanyl-D-alanine-endopeptidase [Tannerella sp.]|jgi:D-alanyl-D-alanine carboxypeptidase/D-alanyl-D-alanine-endopeptidase (penicillin-binding protein 4)|nr:D-alanyl-D-alanine carboxypeptidase/D-alanyl-D-alanine-endopeptidase [Tannerella sp.]